MQESSEFAAGGLFETENYIQSLCVVMATQVPVTPRDYSNDNDNKCISIAFYRVSCIFVFVINGTQS